MIDRNYFSHTIPGYGKVWDKLNAIGYCYKLAGENIGWNNYPDDGDGRHPADVHGLARSPREHHGQDLGHGRHRRLQGLDGKKMWTVLFADRCGSTAPKPTPKPRPAEADRTAGPRTTPKPAPKATPRPTPKPAAVATPELTPASTPDLGPEATSPGDNLIFPAPAASDAAPSKPSLDPAGRS